MSRPPHRSPVRRGVALLATLVLLVLLLLVTTGVLHQALGDARRGRDHTAATIAGAAADAGAYSLLRDWAGFDFDSMRPGDTIPSSVLAAGNARVVVRGRRVSALAWWITAFAFTPDSVSPLRTARRVNLVLRQATPELATAAAVTLRDSGTVSGTGSVSGTDTSTGVWAATCPSPPVDAAGIAAADTSRVVHGSVTGLPALEQDSLAAAPSTWNTFGAESWSGLAGRADVVLAGGAIVTPSPASAAGACDRRVATNWGEPSGTGPCARHAPIVWARGDLEVRGGRGQGVLLVDGDVVFSQGAEFHGVVVARDDLSAGPGGGRVFGSVIAADSVSGAGDHTWIGDGLRIQRSSCTVTGVLMHNARLVPVVRRSWAPMP